MWRDNKHSPEALRLLKCPITSMTPSLSKCPHQPTDSQSRSRILMYALGLGKRFQSQPVPKKELCGHTFSRLMRKKYFVIKKNTQQYEPNLELTILYLLPEFRFIFETIMSR